MHDQFLKRAFALAETRRGFCAPNPSVAAILVKKGKVIAEGVHWAAGHAHAEVEALSKVTIRDCEGASLYVTLEPCTHFGKTPPCTDFIIQRRLKEVYYAFKDPNPVVSGKGERQLRAAGIECRQISSPEAEAFYRSYFYWWKHKRPYVTAKIALSMDGKIAKKGGVPVQLTGEGLKHFTHSNRRVADAILTTSKTLLADNPRLNVRLEKRAIGKRLYVLDSKLSLKEGLRAFRAAEQVVIFHSVRDQPAKSPYSGAKFKLVKCPKNGALLDLNFVLEKIGEQGVHALWVEAGGKCFESLARLGYLNEALIYLSPKWVGSEGVSAFREFPFRKGCSFQWQCLEDEVFCHVRW